MYKIPVLKIKDAKGNPIPINAIRGEKGKDAYEQAKDGGYTGTVEQFIALLNGLTATADANHYANLDNPHQVTAEQVGALPITGGYLEGGLGFVGEGGESTSEFEQNSDYATIIRNRVNDISTVLAFTNDSKVDMSDVLKLWFANGNGYSIYGEHNKPSSSDVGAIPEKYYASDDLNTELQQGGSKMNVCSYHSETLNTPYKEGLTVFAHGMVITNAYDSNYGTQLCMPSGEDAIYVRRLNGSGISQWVKLQNSGAYREVVSGIWNGSDITIPYPSGFNKDNSHIISCKITKANGTVIEQIGSGALEYANDGIKVTITTGMGQGTVVKLLLEKYEV